MKVSEKQTLKRKKIAIAISSAIQQSSQVKLTVDEMCEAAGIAKGTFYHYFSSKEDLLSEALYAIPIDDLFSIIEKDIKKCNSFIDAVTLYTKSYSEHILSSGFEICRAVLMEMLDPENTRFRSYDRITVRLLYDIITTWQGNGAVTKEHSAKQICDMFMVAIRGYLLNWYASGGRYDLSDAMVSHTKLFASSFMIQ